MHHHHLMHFFIWIISFLCLIIISGSQSACLHNQTKGKHCTLNTRSSLERLLIQPTATEHQECHTLCIQSGYTGGGHCSVSEECFRFCFCSHSDN
jgi:hypothetical protein